MQAGSVKRFIHLVVGSDNRSIEAASCKDAATAGVGENLGVHLQIGRRGGICSDGTCGGHCELACTAPVDVFTCANQRRNNILNVEVRIRFLNLAFFGMRLD